ncbi:MAG TPA: DUF5659 domain-containing protein [Candidatus Paceibacterota bacterium]|nr:DUF5659 domain-containing protein [Candidatus Paceibacterota bacterium]
MNKQQMWQKQDELVYIPLNDTENYFYSTDLGLVASLLSIGFELTSIDKEHPSKALFIIKKEYDIEDTIDEYFSGQLMVPARVLFDKIELLKSMIHNSL